jgi:hypothetical protein
MRLIHFKQLEMLLEVVESSENIASSATVLKLLTSSRFIARVSRRYCETNQGDVNTIIASVSGPSGFCNQEVVLRATLRMHDKLLTWEEMGKLRLLNS